MPLTETNGPQKIADAAGIALVVSDGLVYPLSECCGASAKGSSSPTGVVCRKCYNTLPEIMGWGVSVNNENLEAELVWFLSEAVLASAEAIERAAALFAQRARAVKA